MDTSPDKCHRHRAIGEMANPRKTSTSRYRRFSTLTKLLVSVLRYNDKFRRKPTETKALEHQQDDRSGDADKDVQGEVITKYSWSEGKNTISIAKQRFFNLTITVCTQQIFKFIDLAHEIPGVQVAKKTWHKLLDEASTKEAVADDTSSESTLDQGDKELWIRRVSWQFDH